MNIVSPESVGFSTARLSRINTVMQRYVDDRKLAGMVMLVARHGQTVHFETCGRVKSNDTVTERAISGLVPSGDTVTGGCAATGVGLRSVVGRGDMWARAARHGYPRPPSARCRYIPTAAIVPPSSGPIPRNPCDRLAQ
jgi:hypothetical protein